MLLSFFVSDCVFSMMGYQLVSALLCAVTWVPLLVCDGLVVHIYATTADLVARVIARVLKLPEIFKSVRKLLHRRCHVCFSAGWRIFEHLLQLSMSLTVNISFMFLSCICTSASHLCLRIPVQEMFITVFPIKLQSLYHEFRMTLHIFYISYISSRLPTSNTKQCYYITNKN